MNSGNPEKNQRKTVEMMIKKPISISSILQSVFSDIERHGTEDEAYTKGIMSSSSKRKIK